MMIVSNHAVPIRVEGDDRRYFVVQVTSEKMAADFYDPLHDWSHSEEGLAALFYHLLHEVDLTGFDPNASAPDTADKADMITSGATAMEAWLIEVLKIPCSFDTRAGSAYSRLLDGAGASGHIQNDPRETITAARRCRR